MVNREMVLGVIRRLRDSGRESDAQVVERLMDDCLPKPRTAADVDVEEVLAFSIIRKARRLLRLTPQEGFIVGCDRVLKDYSELLSRWIKTGEGAITTGEVSISEVSELITKSDQMIGNRFSGSLDETSS